VREFGAKAQQGFRSKSPLAQILIGRHFLYAAIFVQEYIATQQSLLGTGSLLQ
jgi:hypothetical protein